MPRRVSFLLPLLLVLLVAGCNLTAITAPTPTPFPTPVPLGEAQSPGVVFVTATPFGDILPDGITPVPTLPPVSSAPTSNAVEWLVQTVVIPAWNFLYDFFFQALSSLWLFAGARGGVFAQVVCCVGPAILLAAAGVRYVLRGRGID